MGGFGSGRWDVGCARTTVEDSKTLNINRLIGQKCLKPGCLVRGTLRWTSSRDGNDQGSIGFEADMRDGNAQPSLRLRYSKGPDAAKRHFEYKVYFTTTHPHLGGKRWWFLCPSIGGRVATLHLPPGRNFFASRKAHGLAYRSQQEAPLFQSLSRAQDLRYRLGGSEYTRMDLPFPSKPKGMWGSTYNRLKKQSERADARAAHLARQRFGCDPW